MTPKNAVKLERSVKNLLKLWFQVNREWYFFLYQTAPSLYYEKYLLDYGALLLTSNKRCNSIFMHFVNQINAIRMLRFRRSLNQQLSHCN